MSPRAIVLVLVAFVAAGGTTLMVKKWIAAERAAAAAAVARPAEPPPPLPEILVAAEMLPTGKVLGPQHLRWQAWPKEAIAPGFAAKGKTDMQRFVGSVVRSRIAAGEPIHEDRIVRPGDRGFLAAILTPGMRAVTVPINATSGIAGLIFPGDRVDVILTHTFGGEGSGEGKDKERARRASETVLENVRVLATDQKTDHEDGTNPAVAKTATVEVTAKQAEVLAMVTELGRLSLSLRSLMSDREIADAEQDAGVGPLGAKQSYTLDSSVSALLDPPSHIKAKKSQVNVLRGKDAEQVSF